MDEQMVIEVHYDNGHGHGGPVRKRYKNSGEFVYLTGTTKGPDGSPWIKQIMINGKWQSLHRLVLMAFDRMPLENEFACHIIPRPKNSFGDNSISNLIWGTPRCNVLDDVGRKGRIHVGSRRPFRGMRDGDDSWTTFETQKAATERTGVSYGSINRSLNDGGWKIGDGGILWTFERFSTFALEEDEKMMMITDLENETRFVTSFGRYGEVMKSPNGDVLHEVELALQGGYKTVRMDSRPIRLHRLIIERFRPEEIEKREKETGLSWNDGGLEVDHVNSDKIDNRIDNLNIVTRQEHRNKNSMAVAEISPDGSRIRGMSWISLKEAGRCTNIHPFCIQSVCEGIQNQTGGRKFVYIKDIPMEEDREDAKKEAVDNSRYIKTSRRSDGKRKFDSI
jgi:hypothetical protein